MRTVLILGLLAAPGGLAAAQDPGVQDPGVQDLATQNPDEEIIVIGQRIDGVAIGDLVAPATRIERPDIEVRSQGTVSDYLRTIPGLAVSRSGPETGLTQVRIRGAEANQTLVLIDGVEANDPNTGEFDFAGLRAEDVASIEVLRGEQSALWGPDAIGGVIAITTSNGEGPMGTRERFRASVEYGTDDTYELHFGGAVPLGAGFSLSANGTVFRTDGIDISPNADGGEGEDDSGSRDSLNGQLRYAGDRVRGGVGYSTSFDSSEFDADADFDGRLNDTPDRLDVARERAFADVTVDVTDALTAKATLARTETDTVNPFAGFFNDTEGVREQATLALAYDTGLGRLTVLGELEDEALENFGGPNAPQNQAESIANEALAAEYRYAGVIDVTASIRQDFNSRFDDATTWRIGAGYDTEWNGRIRGSVGTGVKNPTLTEIFGFFPGSFIGNPDIQPERSLGYNIGYDQRVGPLRLSVNAFRSELDDEILTVFNPDFTSTVVNLETESTREGVELEAGLELDTVSFRGSATLMDAEEGDAEEIRRPDFMASATVVWNASDAVQLSAFVDHTGSQIDTDFETFSPMELDAFTLVGARAAWEVRNGLTIYARGENLFDEDYVEVVGFEPVGRRVLVGLSADY